MGLLCSISFLITIFIEIILNSQLVVTKSTERDHMHPLSMWTPFPPGWLSAGAALTMDPGLGGLQVTGTLWFRRMKASVDLVSGENWLPGSPVVSSGCVLTWWEGAVEFSGVSLTRALIPSWGLHPHDLLMSQRLSPPNPITIGVGFQDVILEGGYKNSVHSNNILQNNSMMSEPG